MTWGAVAGAAIGAAGAYLSAREQKKTAAQAAKPRETYQSRIPYMNEYISKTAPYILREAQKIYESRLKGYGMTPGDFSPIAQMLAGIPSSYTGVGGPGGAPSYAGGGTGGGGSNFKLDPGSYKFDIESRGDAYKRQTGTNFEAPPQPQYTIGTRRPDSGAMAPGNADDLINYWGV